MYKDAFHHFESFDVLIAFVFHTNLVFDPHKYKLVN
jgi:hypothetical protein